MNSIKISDITIGENVRKDLGDLKELEESIKEHGVLVPLILDKKNALVAGHRRLQAATNVGLKEVPYVTTDSEGAAGRAEIQILENLHRKDLDPLEEAKAYVDYMAENECDEEKLATRLKKSVDYINRRINLLRTTVNVQEALKKGYISIGHANILSQMNKKQQEISLKNVIEYDLTVQNFADQVRWMKKIDFGNLKFRPAEENTGQQSLFDSIGRELNPKNQVEIGSYYQGGEDWKESPAFQKELAAYVESQRELLREKGIKVYPSDDDLRKDWPEAVEIAYHRDEYKKALKDLPGSKIYAVVVDISYDDISKEVYRLIPKKQAAKESSQKDETPAEAEKREHMLEQSKSEKLKEKVHLYKREKQLAAIEQKVFQASAKKQKVMVLWSLINRFINTYEMPEEAKELMKAIGGKRTRGSWGEWTNTIECLQTLSEQSLDVWILKAASWQYSGLPEHDLNVSMDMLGFKLSKDWKIDEEYLSMHTKSQLESLAKELKLGPYKGKKSEIIKDFLKDVKKGMVPKAMTK